MKLTEPQKREMELLDRAKSIIHTQGKPDALKALQYIIKYGK